jgi:uncharacterized protein (TIGR03435 family)
MMVFPGGRLSVSNTPLRLLIRNPYSVLDLQIVNGPEWIKTERFDIDATSTVIPRSRRSRRCSGGCWPIDSS